MHLDLISLMYFDDCFRITVYTFGGNVLNCSNKIFMQNITSVYFPLALFFMRFTPYMNIDPLFFIWLNGHGTVSERLTA